MSLASAVVAYSCRSLLLLILRVLLPVALAFPMAALSRDAFFVLFNELTFVSSRPPCAFQLIDLIVATFNLSLKFSNVHVRATLLSHLLPIIRTGAASQFRGRVARVGALDVSFCHLCRVECCDLGRARCVLPRVLPHGVPSPW